MGLSIYMTGVGGQGILTIAELIMAAAVNKGYSLNYFPTKGMAQRGGFVKAQLRIDQSGYGPDIRKGGADVVIAMELSEALRGVSYLKPGGDMVVYGHRWLPTDVMLNRADYPTPEQVEAEAHSAGRYTYLEPEKLPEGGAGNMFLLAAAYRHTALNSLFTVDELIAAMDARFPKGMERNHASFEAGLL